MPLTEDDKKRLDEIIDEARIDIQEFIYRTYQAPSLFPNRETSFIIGYAYAIIYDRFISNYRFTYNGRSPTDQEKIEISKIILNYLSEIKRELGIK